MSIKLDPWSALAIIFVAWAIASMFSFKFQINIVNGCDQSIAIERTE